MVSFAASIGINDLWNIDLLNKKGVLTFLDRNGTPRKSTEEQEPEGSKAPGKEELEKMPIEERRELLGDLRQYTGYCSNKYDPALSSPMGAFYVRGGAKLDGGNITGAAQDYTGQEGSYVTAKYDPEKEEITFRGIKIEAFEGDHRTISGARITRGGGQLYELDAETLRIIPSQKRAAQQVLEAVRVAYPGSAITPEAIQEMIRTKILPANKPPRPYSKGYSVHPVTTATAGSFAVPYYKTMTGEVMVVLQRRSDGHYGAFGGYTDIDAQEQPQVGCAREISEELIRPVDGAGPKAAKPVLDIDPAKLGGPLNVTIDYSKPLAVIATGFGLELTPQEVAAIQEHAARIKKDPEYKAAASLASHGEVAEVFTMPIQEARQLQHKQFTHPHELDAINKLDEKLQTAEREKARNFDTKAVANTAAQYVRKANPLRSL